MACAATLVLFLAVVTTAVAVTVGMLRSTDKGTDGPGSSPAASPAAPPQATIGECTVTLTDMETGLDAVGPRSSRVEAKGQFVVVTVEIVNGTGSPLTLSDPFTLVLADGTTIASDRKAGGRHVAETKTFDIVTAGETVRLHAVFDAQLGAEVASLKVDLGSARGAGQGTLDLAG